jgi:trans-aconitate methyltransferase
MSDLTALARRTADVYARQGLQFDAERSKVLFEQPWLDRFLSLLPAQPAVLDAGCGAGAPIAEYLIAQDCRLTGIDMSAPMLELARARFPQATWLAADMRTLNLPEQFDGIIGWHSFFHLTPDEQPTTLHRFAAHLRARGVLMITVGSVASEAVGYVGGEPVYHASLALDDYASILARLGMHIVSFVAEDPGCGHATILLAQKAA